MPKETGASRLPSPKQELKELSDKHIIAAFIDGENIG